MDTPSRIKNRTNRGEAAVWEYLDTSCGGSVFNQDPAVRGMRALLIYGRDQWAAGWDVLRTSPAFRSEAETTVTTLFGDVLHYWARRNLNFDLLQHRVWELRGEFEPFDFGRFADESELAALATSDVTEVIARLLADLLLCAERLQPQLRRPLHQRTAVLRRRPEAAEVRTAPARRAAGAHRPGHPGGPEAHR
ncbi:hypothetical protein SALBM311S_00617 [Streptomyces alboniger]